MLNYRMYIFDVDKTVLAKCIIERDVPVDNEYPLG